MSFSSPVLTAIHSLQESLEHYLLFPFNFPFEGTKCIPLLRQAIELLLRVHTSDEDLSGRGMKVLVDTYGEFTYAEDGLIKWLSDKRNDIMHEGEVQWEDREVVSSNVRELISIAGKLLFDLGGSFPDELTSWQRELLAGRTIDRRSESRFLSEAAIGYAAVDEEIAIEISNAAFEKALRLMAMRWGIENAEEIYLADLVATLYEFEDERAPYYIDRRLDETDAWTELGQGKFAIPLSLAQIQGIAGRSQTNLAAAVELYAQEVAEAVNSYIERTPSAFAHCVIDNWDRIVSVFYEIDPQAELPCIDQDRWGKQSFMEDRLEIPLARGESKPVWLPSDYRALLVAISAVCGGLPDTVHIHFAEPLNWDMLVE